jgi:3-methyladenine DNA glycosylase AlkC
MSDEEKRLAAKRHLEYAKKMMEMKKRGANPSAMMALLEDEQAAMKADIARWENEKNLKRRRGLK